jgi:ABC-type sugar transport system ATPase subunit
VLHDINVNVRKGEVVGIAGLMGAGRTEFAMSVFGKSYGHKITGDVLSTASRRCLSTVRKAIDARPRLCHRGPQASRPQPDRQHQAQHHARQSGRRFQEQRHRRHRELAVANDYRSKTASVLPASIR